MFCLGGKATAAKKKKKIKKKKKKNHVRLVLTPQSYILHFEYWVGQWVMVASQFFSEIQVFHSPTLVPAMAYMYKDVVPSREKNLWHPQVI